MAGKQAKCPHASARGGHGRGRMTHMEEHGRSFVEDSFFDG